MITTQNETSHEEQLENAGWSLVCSSPLPGVDESGWPHLAYQCQIFLNGKLIWSGPYKMGVGNFGKVSGNPPASLPSDLTSVWYVLATRPNAKFEDQSVVARIAHWLAARNKISPKISGVLYSILSDSDGGDMSHADFCATFGYSDDSIKALRIWEDCRETNRKLGRVPDEDLAKAREILSDF